VNEGMNERAFTQLTPDEVLEGLRRALAAERQAVADYGAHARAYDQPGVREALEALRDVEREHALRLSLRITALGESPPSQEATAKPAGEGLAASLALDLEAEQSAIVEYARLVAGIVDDDETVDMMTELLLDEIRHASWLKSTLRSLQAA
jgi:bacterioferritin (cytochrome b1)